MTSQEEYEITEKDIKEYGGKGRCFNLGECVFKLESKVCGLKLGYLSPTCPRMSSPVEESPAIALKKLLHDSFRIACFEDDEYGPRDGLSKLERNLRELCPYHTRKIGLLFWFGSINFVRNLLRPSKDITLPILMQQEQERMIVHWKRGHRNESEETKKLIWAMETWAWAVGALSDDDYKTKETVNDLVVEDEFEGISIEYIREYGPIERCSHTAIYRDCFDVKNITVCQSLKNGYRTAQCPMRIRMNLPLIDSPGKALKQLIQNGLKLNFDDDQYYWYSGNQLGMNIKELCPYHTRKVELLFYVDRKFIKEILNDPDDISIKSLMDEEIERLYSFFSTAYEKPRQQARWPVETWAWAAGRLSDEDYKSRETENELRNELFTGVPIEYIRSYGPIGPCKEGIWEEDFPCCKLEGMSAICELRAGYNCPDCPREKEERNTSEKKITEIISKARRVDPHFNDKDYQVTKDNAGSATSIAACCEELGGLYNEIGNYERELEYYRKALDIRKQIYSVYPEDRQNIYDLASCYNDPLRRLNDDERFECRLESLQTLEPIYQATNDNFIGNQIVENCRYIGDCLKAKDCKTEAILYYKKACAIINKGNWVDDKRSNEEKVLAANIYHSYAVLLKEMKQNDQAAQYFQKTIAICASWIHEKPNTTIELVLEVGRRIKLEAIKIHVDACFRYGELLVELGQTEEGRAMVEKACDLAESSSDEELIKTYCFRGWNHPQCPVNIWADERLSKNPEYVAKMASVHEVAEHARQLLEKLEARKKEREGKKTE